MLARIQQAITTSLVLLALSWAAWFLATDRPLWAIGGALLILFGYAVFLAVEFALLAFVGRADPAPRPTPVQLLRAWCGEVVSAPRVFCWRQPFRATAEPDHLPADGNARTGCLLVHGFVCNRALWNPWMQRLRDAGVPFVAVNLEPVFGSVDEYVPILDAAARRIVAATGRPPLVVAHSMGGLAVRAWLDRTAAAVEHVITIGTPHQGTWLARFGMTANGHQMRIDNPWLGALGARESAGYARYTCFYSHCDNIVFPPSTATLPGADNRHLPGCAHVHLAFQEAIVNEALRRLGTAGAESPRARIAQ